ncbi:MAG: hypothetical protein FJY65_02420 [Calditrichaeota bacterium]|nr:hypothetical protein [Calditrichota bacterium]
MVRNNHLLISGERLRLLTPVILALFISLAGCDLMPGDLKGTVESNQNPVVEFANVPADSDVFSYAPVVYWKGRDPDGFVEYFLYADIIDSTALADPDYYIPFIPAEAWRRTEASSDTIFLLTTPGQVTQHIFYLKCVDDRGAESAVIYRRFFRTNKPPNVPRIKWFTAPDDSFNTDIRLRDTLYVLDRTTEIWSGLGFTWRSSDPDDRDLYKIPLEYRYYLEKVPHDTIWQWVARDWTIRQDLVFSGLETGHYRFTVWVRDDSYELSARPASADFDVYKPTFEQTILLFNSTSENPNGRPNRGNVIPGTQIGDLYRSLASRYPDVNYVHYPNPDSITLHKAYLGRFRLVIWCSENMDPNEAPFESALRDYVRVGGNLWVVGSFVRKNILPSTAYTIINLANGSRFGGPLAGVSVPTNEAEFTGAKSGVRDLPDLAIDTAVSADVFRRFFTQRYKTYPLLPGIDIMTAGSSVETVYYFKSYTDTASGDVRNDLAEVRTWVDTINYPPTPVDCILRLSKKRVLEVTRVYNATRGDSGEVLTLTNNVGSSGETVVKVSYKFGTPWAPGDTVWVNYRYQPYSEFHLKPCGIRFERLYAGDEGAFEIRYRIAIFTFPLYFLDNSGGKVSEMFNRMLDWFFLPYAH